MGHGRALLNISSLTKQLSVYEKILKKSLSVRDTEKLVSQIKGISSKSVKSVPEFYIKIKEHIQRRYDTNIKFKLSKKTKSVSFDFQNSFWNTGRYIDSGVHREFVFFFPRFSCFFGLP